LISRRRSWWKDGVARGGNASNGNGGRVEARRAGVRRCGATTKLVAHHFKSWDEFPELRLDVDNGITLCKPCHQSIHASKPPDPAFVHIPAAAS
jgi:hypothetical protein